MSKPIFQVMSVDELLRTEFAPTDSLLGGNLLDKSGAMLISGPQKIGKSLFATQLALSLAARRAFLGFGVGGAEYRILILQAEVAPKRMKERFEKQVKGFCDLEALTRVLSVSVFSSVKLDNPTHLSMVQSWVEQHAPNVIIVDPLTNFHTGDENVAQDMTRITTVLDHFRGGGIAVIVVHHHGKNNSGSNVGHKARGSSVLPGWYDSHCSLEWADPQTTVRLRFELRHDETPESMILKLNRETLLFDPQEDFASQVGLVVSIVRDKGPLDAETVAATCGKTRQWASDWLNRAVQQGRLTKTDTRPILYSAPGQPTPQTTVVVNTNTSSGPPTVIIDGERVQFD